MYHGWTYHLDGRNRSVSAPDTFPKFDRSNFGLKPIELEVFMGHGVRALPRAASPSVAERMAPHAAELAHYRIDQMVPLDELWVHDVEIDWKNVVENYVEDYHFPMGHPGLSALMEAQYDREVLPAGTMRLSHRMRAKPLKSWSAQRYAKFLPGSSTCRRTCGDAGPISACSRTCTSTSTRSGSTSSSSCRPGPGARDSRPLVWLPGRPPRDAGRALAVRAPQCARAGRGRSAHALGAAGALESGAYTQGILSDKEIVLAGFQDWIRDRLPVTQLTQAPARGTVAARNSSLAALTSAGVRSRADTTRSRDP